ncbi:MAG: tRNA epoxyqueuosine(34) reductase QueG [Actinobacteria bacterium]|nr:tRNA epoxyqueuosine(34) reductase QueG [Actinomycetota bacterium]
MPTTKRDGGSSELHTLAGDLEREGLAAGLDAVGVAPATPFEGTRRLLEERKAAGLSAGMQFTFRNPVRSTTPSAALPGAKSIVVGARSYRRREPSGAVTAPVAPGTVARYSWVDHYVPLRRGLERIAERLRGAGWRARVLADDNALVDREAAYRAGLGWYGKNTNLLLVGRGSWFVLGAVVTDAALPSNGEPAADGCGTCTRCLPACPTGALVTPGVLDARRCLAWLLQAEGVFPREHRVALGARIYGCDDCQEVCPPNRVEISRRPPPPAEPAAEATVELLEILEERDDDALLQRFGRWYIPARQPRYLRRNALVALGNVACGGDVRVERALRSALQEPDAIVRGHAVWAAARVGRGDLVEELIENEDDPQVRAELAALPAPRAGASGTA